MLPVKGRVNGVLRIEPTGSSSFRGRTAHSERSSTTCRSRVRKHPAPEGDAGIASGIIVAEIAEADYVGGAAVACRASLPDRSLVVRFQLRDTGPNSGTRVRGKFSWRRE